MALTLERLTDFAGMQPARGTYSIKANVRIFKGAMVALDSAGRAMPAGLAAGGSIMVVGKASATYDNRTGSVLGGGADACDVEVEYGVFAWEDDDGDMDDTNVGLPVYCVDDQSVSADSGSSTQIVAGLLTEVRNGQAWVYMGPHAFALASAYAGAASGVALQKRSVTVGHADLTDADTSQDINIGAVLPANARILGVSIHTVTAFAGGTVSALALDIGTSGDIDALVDGADLFAAAVDGQAATRPLGIAPNKLYASAGAQLVARFVSTGDNLVNLTAGTATIDVLFSVLA